MPSLKQLKRIMNLREISMMHGGASLVNTKEWVLAVDCCGNFLGFFGIAYPTRSQQVELGEPSEFFLAFANFGRENCSSYGVCNILRNEKTLVIS